MGYDFGRHLTMLPSRGLRPAQLAPLTSRQSTLICSKTARKVRLPQMLESSPQATSTSTSASACRRVTLADVGLLAPTYASRHSYRDAIVLFERLLTCKL
jgi:hypothetical protein